MNKKLLLVIFTIILSICALFTSVVFAEESGTPNYPCKVVYAEMHYGDAIASIEEGNVGDVVTIICKPYALCSVESVQVNGVDLTVNEDGYYQFCLVEGENVISATFSIDQEQVAAIASIYNQTKEKGLKSLFTMENLFNLVSWAITILFSSGFLITLIKTKMIKSKTSEDVVKTTQLTIKDSTKETLSNFMENDIKPILLDTEEKIAGTNKITEALCRCIILMLDGTSDSKMAIIKELTSLSTSSDEVARQVKLIIEQQVAKQVEIQKDKENQLETLENANNSLTIDNLGSEKEGETNVQF